MVSEVHIWIHGGQSPAQFQHLMHLPNVDATFQQLMHIPIVDAFSVAIPTSWCHIPTVEVIFSHIPTIDAPSNCWCTYQSSFQQLMPVPIVDAQFYHNSNKFMHFPTVDDTFSLNSNTMMLIPTSWCKFQHVDANSNTLMLIPTSWCTFQLLMHIFSPLTNFVSFSRKRKGPNWFWPQPKTAKAGHVDAHSNNLMPFSYCYYATFQQVDAPSNCWYHFYYATLQQLMHLFQLLMPVSYY